MLNFAAESGFVGRILHIAALIAGAVKKFAVMPQSKVVITGTVALRVDHYFHALIKKFGVFDLIGRNIALEAEYNINTVVCHCHFGTAGRRLVGVHDFERTDELSLFPDRIVQFAIYGNVFGIDWFENRFFR